MPCHPAVAPRDPAGKWARTMDAITPMLAAPTDTVSHESGTAGSGSAAPRRGRRTAPFAFPLILLATMLAGCASSSHARQPDPDAIGMEGYRHVDDLYVVDCLLPGEVRQLGRMTYLTPRRPVKTTAFDCRVRGGEYVAYDRANYKTALRVWREKAEGGDAEAQVIVGEIYEKGLGISPDYASAAEWYRKAADQGNERALTNLAYLYEQGLGVEQDLAKAINLYRKAAGDVGDELMFASAARDKVEKMRAELERELNEARTQQRALTRQIEELQQRLAQQQSQRQEDKETIAALQNLLADTNARLADKTQRLDHLASMQVPRGSAGEDERGETMPPDTVLSEKEIEEAREELVQREQAIERREQELASREAQLAQKEVKLRKEIESQRQALAREETRIREELESKRETLAREEAEVREELKELEARREALAQAEVDTGEELQARREALNRREAELQERIQARRDALALQQAEAEQELQARREALARQEATVRAQAEARRDAKVQLEALKRELAQARDEARIRAEALTSREETLKRQEEALTLQAEVLKRREEALARREQELTQQASSQVTDIEKRQREPEASTLAKLRERMDFGRYYALVIGLQDYRYWDELGSARRDASRIADVLASKYGFETQVLHDAGAIEILAALNELRGRTRESDNVLIYFAGRGQLRRPVQDSLVGYWLPIDARREMTTLWLPNSQINEQIALLEARGVMVVADSCFAGAMSTDPASLLTGSSVELTERRIRLGLERRARYTLSSGGLHPVMDPREGEHSIFARAMIEVLTQNNGVLSEQALVQQVADRVTRRAEEMGIEQRPELKPIRSAGHIPGGSFYLVPRGNQTATLSSWLESFGPIGDARSVQAENRGP